MRRLTRKLLCSAVLVLATAAAGCTSDADPEAVRACGLIDRAVVEDVTGSASFANSGSSSAKEFGEGIELLAIGKADDGSPKNKFDCTVTDVSSHSFIQLAGGTLADDAERAKLASDFTQAASVTGCKPRTESPEGYLCTQSGRTSGGLLLADRWMRVTLDGKSTNGTEALAPDVDLLLRVAKNVDSNLDATQ